MIAGYWTAGRKEDKWTTLSDALPKLSYFLAQGYQIDSLVSRGTRGLIWFGGFSERVIDQKIWTHWIPHTAYVAVKFVSDGVSRGDSKLTSGLNRLLGTLIEVPAKALQRIQTGDLRWYLFLALSSGFVLMLHFLKT